MVVCILYNHIQCHNFHMYTCYKLGCNLIPSNHSYKLEIIIKMFKCLFATLTDFLHNFVPYIPRHSNKFHFPNKFCAFHIWNTIFLVPPHNLCCNIFLHIQVYHKHFHCSHPCLVHSSFYICVDLYCQTIELPKKFLKIIGKSSCPQWCFLRLLPIFLSQKCIASIAQYPVVRLPKHLLKKESFPWPEKLLRIVTSFHIFSPSLSLNPFTILDELYFSFTFRTISKEQCLSTATNIDRQ
jgi:hypothetical protein